MGEGSWRVAEQRRQARGAPLVAKHALLTLTSQNLAPTYEQLADAFANSKDKVIIAKVDADGAGKPLGQKFGVTGFPSTCCVFLLYGKDLLNAVACLQHLSGSVPMAASPKSTTVVVISTLWPTCESPSTLASRNIAPPAPSPSPETRASLLFLFLAVHSLHPSYKMTFIWLRFLTIRDETIYMS